MHRALFAALALTGPAAADLAFDLSRPLHRFEGIGVNCFPGDETLPRFCDELGIRWARFWFDCKQPLPAEDTVEAYRKWWQADVARESVARAVRLFKERNVKVIAGMGMPPKGWLEGPKNRLPAARHQPFARLWAAGVLHLQALGGEIHGIELYNEPDGTWNAHITPEENAAIIRRVRAELDKAGLEKVLICAPGTSHVDWGHAGDPYVNAMEPKTVAAVGAWSNHTWDWSVDRVPPDMRRHFVRLYWPNVIESFRRKDPELKKPVYVTEAGTGALEFHGRDWTTFVDPATPDASKCDALPQGIRTVENALSLANLGANALMMWQASDLSWSTKRDGLLRSRKLGDTPRPAYEALRTFSSDIPADARVATIAGYDPVLYGAAFLGAEKLVVVIANGTPQAAEAALRLKGLEGWKTGEVRRFPDKGDPGIWSPEHPAVSLPGDSVLALVFHKDR